MSQSFSAALMQRHFWLVTSFILVMLCSLEAIAADDIIMVMPDDFEQFWTHDRLVNPAYPKDAAESGTTGCAAIAFIVEANGRASNLRVLTSLPEAGFGRSSLKAVKKWRFKPAAENPSRQLIYTYQVLVFDRSANRSDAAGDACAAESERIFIETASEG